MNWIGYRWIRDLGAWTDKLAKLKALALPSSQRQSKKYYFLCALCALSEAGGEFSFTELLSNV